MKTKLFQYLKITIVSAVFMTAFAGLRYTSSKARLANVSYSKSMLALGNEAQAYCNEATYWGETNTGTCNGAFGNSSSKCVASTNPNNTDCIMEF